MGNPSSEFDRRTALRAGALVAVGAALPALAAGAAPAAGAQPHGSRLPAPTARLVKPFPLTDVTVDGGRFARYRDWMLSYARAYPADRILANFRRTAGLDTRGAEPPGGWDDATGLLRGHYSGHFLSMLAQSFASTGDPELRRKIDYLVAELGACQDAMTASGKYSHPGYLAAYPEDQFAKLEAGAPYPQVWAPWYTCHKILSGLLDCHRLVGNAQALTIASRLGEWAHSRLSKLTDEQRQRIWGTYIAGEYGGMNERLVELAELTGNPVFVTTAGYFDKKVLLDACAQDRDILDNLHANQHIPQFLGYLKMYDHTGDERYFRAVENFWAMVVPHRIYSHGGTGQGERFRARDAIIATVVGDTNAESCACYNMLKLSRELYFRTADPKYMEYYERGLYNQILGSREDVPSDDDPRVAYMVPVGPGAVRGFGNIGTCCGGTGMENHTKYQDSVYFVAADHSAVHVNLYIPSTLRWREGGLTLIQETAFPEEGVSTFTVRKRGPLEIRFRVPSWVRRGFRVTVNGQPWSGQAEPGSYLSVRRTWSGEDRVRVEMPLSLRVERAIDDPTKESMFNGPVLLVARSAETNYRPVSLYRNMTLDGGVAREMVPAGKPNFFTHRGVTWAPMYVGTTHPTHVYYQRVEPTVAFGGADTGVPNRADSSRLTFLDQVWDQGPFTSTREFASAVDRVAARFVAAGLFTAAEQRTVTEAARRTPPQA